MVRPVQRKSKSVEAQQSEISFSAADDGAGLTIQDHVERQQFDLLTPSPVSPRAADPTRFWFPTDAAVHIETEHITLPTVVVTYVRDDNGEMLAEAEHLAYQEFEEGRYSIELCAPMKLYLRVEGSITVSADMTCTYLDFGAETDVFVGARSHHKRPAGTVTTTDDPADVMRGISTFGSALKTTTVERSYPTLRGHPPLLERGDEFHVPEGIDAPDTGVTIELPETLDHAFVAAPLAYYLGATVTPGHTPRIVTDRGYEYRLDSPLGFEREVARVLKQIFFFDCVTRTEGYYEVDLNERSQIENSVDLDFAALYDAPLAEQVATYLDVSFATVSPYLPDWKLTTHVAPRRDNIDLLSFLTNDLAVIRTPDTASVSTSAAQSAAAGEFFRDDFTRSVSSAPTARSYVQPADTESVEQAWVGEGTPIGASKASATAYRNRLSRSLTDGDISITVVCNDSKMAEESDIVDDVYGSREELPLEVTLHRSLTKTELHDVLTSQTDFLHYIGHIDAEGFQCVDGKLDASMLTNVGADAFLLNACSSYEQGSRLIEVGAIAGIVTLSDVVNSGAVKMGKMLARLLNQGFGLQNALNVARDESVIGEQYTVVGDGGLSIAQTDGGVPNACVLTRLGEDRFELEFQTYTSDMGTIVIPFAQDVEQHYLASGVTETFEMTTAELADFLALESIPVKIDGELHWSNELNVDDF